MALTGYPADNLIFVEGMVEQTVFDIKRRTSSRCCDWTRIGTTRPRPRSSTSTRACEGGILMLDDTGHYKGQQLAADDDLKPTGKPIRSIASITAAD